MKRLWGILIGLTILPGLRAQEILTLKSCYERAAEVSALAAEKPAYAEIWQRTDKNLQKQWMPTLDAGGTLLYNSSVVDMEDVIGRLPLPGIGDMLNPLPHEQYKITVDVSQTLYDGGAVKSARALGEAELRINEKQTDTELYKLKNQVNTAYFSLMLLRRQRELLHNYDTLIGRRINAVQSAVDNGVILKADLDALRAEKIRLEQQLSENEIRSASLTGILSDLTGLTITPSTELAFPLLTEEIHPGIFRPELEIFDLKKEQLSASLKMLDSKRMPKAFGFSTLGYGNPPGNNFFRDEFAPYFIVGASLKWNIFDWDKSKREKEIIGFQQEILDHRKKDLTDGLERLLESKRAEIATLRKLTQSDEELIALRKKITTSAESRFKNGTLTSTAYLQELNAEKEAVITREIHRINLALAQVEYLTISGKEL
jgi:outer membrane protein TolC